MNVEKALIFIGIAIIILAIVILFCHLDDKQDEKSMNNYLKEQEEKNKNLMENQKEKVDTMVEAINNKEIFDNPIDTFINGITN